ncbi:MAG: aminotransferase class IV [Odoribacter sp.]|nr:aminotransferase class IV [Odoribacter sp.]
MIFLNNVICDGEKFSEKIFENGLSIYEVIRIFNGHPIFLSDNLIRLDNSLKKSNIGIQIESLNIPEKLNRLISLEHITEGNLKYVLHFTTGKTDEYMFQIPHTYPDAGEYENGVPVITCKAVRENPEIKYINTDLRTLTNRLIREHQVYEVLLVDREGYITEGSRSNVFFIKEGTLFTSPAKYVLPGTSRKRVFDICQKHRFPVVEKRIAYTGLPAYDAVFLTGTSPLILPVNRINEIPYSAGYPFLRRLMDCYFALLEK